MDEDCRNIRFDHVDAPVPIAANVGKWVGLTDGPQFPGTTSISIDMHFKSYLVFRPNVGNASDNIYVTLARVEWSWTAAALYHTASQTWDVSSICPDPQLYGDDTFPFYLRTLANGVPYP